MYPAAMKVFGDMNQDGRSVELTATATDIMWRNVGDTTWKTLCPKSDLKGEPGALSSLTPRYSYNASSWHSANDNHHWHSAKSGSEYRYTGRPKRYKCYNHI